MEMFVTTNRQNLLGVATGLRNVSERLAGGGLAGSERYSSRRQGSKLSEQPLSRDQQ